VPPFLMSAATDTTISTSISKPKNKPASLVDTATPRIIIRIAQAVKITEKMTHGTFQLK